MGPSAMDAQLHGVTFPRASLPASAHSFGSAQVDTRVGPAQIDPRIGSASASSGATLRSPGDGASASQRDFEMRELFREYSSILASSDTAAAIKARLAAISACASSQGLTGAMSLPSLHRLRQSLSDQLNPLGGHAFRVFYKFVFFMSREQGQKGVDVATAVEAWRFALAGVFPLVDSWCDFVPLHQRYAVSEDTWQQVLDFSCTIGADLSMYDSDGAWPVLIDEFVECYSRREHLGLSCDVCGRRPSVLLRSPSSHAFRQRAMDSGSGFSSFNEARWLTTNGGATTATPNFTDAEMADDPLSSLQAASSTPSALLSALSVQAGSLSATAIPGTAPVGFSSSQQHGSAMDSNRGISIGGGSSIDHNSNYSGGSNSMRPSQDGVKDGVDLNLLCPGASPSCPIAIPLPSTHRPGLISPTGVEAFQNPTYRQGPFSPTSVEPFQSPTHRTGPFSPSRGGTEGAGGAGRMGAARRGLGTEVVDGIGAGMGAVGRGIAGAYEAGGLGILGRGGGGSERVKRCWRDVREETEQRERIESISLKMARLSPPNGDCKRQRVTQW